MSKLILFNIAVFLLAIAAPAMAIPYSDTVTFTNPGNLLNGTGTFTWSHALPADFEIPYDTINSARLVISANRAAGNNDFVSVIDFGTLGALTGQGNNKLISTTFDLFTLNVFSPTWTAGQSLDLSLTYNAPVTLTMVSSLLNFDYNNNPPPPVPEPATFLLLGAGIAGGSLLRKKLRKQSKISSPE